MKADSISVQDFFQAERRHLVPLYQRPYVWKPKEQWELLWDDLRQLTERAIEGKATRPHFLGAIVLDQIKTSIHEVPARLIIDGQQRLTTLQIVMAALRDLCLALPDDSLSRRLDRLTRNENASLKSDQRFKVLPTNPDRPAFRELMSSERHHVPEARIQAAQAVSVGNALPVGAYAYFSSTLDAWLRQRGDDAIGERAATLLNVICQRVNLVAIDLGDDDEAQAIFETLNARGAPLLPTDLVKNYLFQAAESEGADLELVYEDRWRGFDQDAKYWRREVKQGRIFRPVVDIFLRHYLTFATRDEAPLAHLFSHYKSFATTQEKHADELLKEFQDFASTYRSFGEFSPDSRRGQFFSRLQTLETSTLVPFLLGLFRRFGGPEDRGSVEAILGDIESFLIRRMVCRFTSKDYNHLFVEMIGALDRAQTANDAAREVRQFLIEQTADSRIWPQDETFGAAWRELPAYSALSRARLRMVLEAIEAAYRSDLTERIILRGTLTVEHLLPRSWEETWPLPTGVDPNIASERRASVLHRFGNLTLLTGKLNPALSNAAWGTKHAKILAHSALALNRNLQGQATWDEQAIEHRTEELLKVALRIWPRPKE